MALSKAPKLQDYGHGASVSYCVPVYSQAYAGAKLYWLETKYVNNVPKVVLDRAAAETEAEINLQSQVQRRYHHATEPPVSKYFRQADRDVI